MSTWQVGIFEYLVQFLIHTAEAGNAHLEALAKFALSQKMLV